jgi:hypothetical protein
MRRAFRVLHACISLSSLSCCMHARLINHLQGSKGVYQNFHAPWNQHNRFLNAATKSDEDAYRDLERRPPPPFDTTGGVRACGNMYGLICVWVCEERQGAGSRRSD